jgi:Tol biopolymer transport system component
MTLAPGTRLGDYEVLSELGAGGMGEVYRARDRRLDRDVAVKLIHGHVCNDPDRVARFQREARTLAALNHPHVASVYGYGESAGVCFLVMELVPGETLAEVIARGGPSSADAIRLGAHIAAALETAHEAGIVHRDLKPANIKIRPDGVAKVLDFGLAKAAGGDDNRLLTQSPTLKSDEGAFTGTVAYMSPEQARGKPVDRRADIWAFGCVMFEMVAGRHPFSAATMSDTLVSILDREPDWTLIPRETPPAVDRLIRRCLRKDSAQRLRDIGDARLDLEDALSAPATNTPAVGALVARRSRMRVVALAILSMAAGVLLTLIARPRPASAPGPPMHFVVALPAAEKLAGLDFPAVAISPDATQIVYVGSRGGRTRLFLRRMNEPQTDAIPGTADAISPFFSPDGTSLGFFAGGKLKKLSLRGGEPVDVCDAAIGFGGSWGPDGTIVFSATTGSGLSRVSAGGGAPSRLTTLDAERGEFSHRWPELLPDGNTVLFTVGTLGSWDDAEIVAFDLKSGRRQILVKGGTNPQYLRTGHLMYARAGTLMAVPFDHERLAVTGTAVRVIDNVMESFDGAAQAAISASGTLTYARGTQQVLRRLIGLDSDRVPTAFAAPLRGYASPRFSPDGRKLAVTIAGTTEDVWIYDIGQTTLQQLTFESNNSAPTWTPDGNSITFTSNRGGALNLFIARADGSSAPERLAKSDHIQVPGSWSPDGKMLAFVEHHPKSGRDIWLLPAAGSGPAQALLQSEFDESSPQFSPDGRWLAYVSNELGRNEIFVRSNSNPPRKHQVSDGGGTEPVWAPDGGRIFYRQGHRLFARELRPAGELRLGKQEVVFDGEFERGTIDRANYDAAPGSGRLVLVGSIEQHSGESELHVVLNWADTVAHLFAGVQR